MTTLADQWTGNAWERVTREVEPDGTITWTARGAEYIQRKRLVKDSNGVIFAASFTSERIPKETA